MSASLMGGEDGGVGWAVRGSLERRRGVDVRGVWTCFCGYRTGPKKVQSIFAM